VRFYLSGNTERAPAKRSAPAETKARTTMRASITERILGLVEHCYTRLKALDAEAADRSAQYKICSARLSALENRLARLDGGDDSKRAFAKAIDR